jgi:hypothetical protein
MNTFEKMMFLGILSGILGTLIGISLSINALTMEIGLIK